ncbi:MAG: 50S ribosomal protein L22 [Phycisphaerales bacterium]|nr:50S ribosomal protein L22 [Phycisphaerales bacterium]
MTYTASHRYCRIAPRKVRLVVDMIRGMDVARAMSTLDFSPRRGAVFVKVVLKSAIANAEERDADVGSLFIKETKVDEGPTIKRFQPKDRGRSHAIKKRTSHIHVTVAERKA